jgi:hypothetical protein
MFGYVARWAGAPPPDLCSVPSRIRLKTSDTLDVRATA